VGWLFVLPALGFYAMFVLQPLFYSLQYSFYEWNGVGVATWVGLENYATVFSDEELLNSIFNAFKLIFFFSVIPVSVGLVTASIIRGAARGRFGTVSRTVLFLPQIIPLVAAGIMWNP
jgi:raffinose/stachyose/melibiose transport system permease protein